MTKSFSFDSNYFKDLTSTCSTVSYYSILAFMIVHPALMVLAYDYWAGFNYILMGLSFQQFLLASFAWAIPDIKYEYWIRNHLPLFYCLSTINLVLFSFGSLLSGYFYFYGAALYSFLGLSVLVYLVLGMGPLVIGVIASFFYINVKFYQVHQDTTEGEGDKKTRFIMNRLE